MTITNRVIRASDRSRMTESDLTDDDEYVAACMSGELSRQIARLEPPFH